MSCSYYNNRVKCYKDHCFMEPKVVCEVPLRGCPSISHKYIVKRTPSIVSTHMELRLLHNLLRFRIPSLSPSGRAFLASILSLRTSLKRWTLVDSTTCAITNIVCSSRSLRPQGFTVRSPYDVIRQLIHQLAPAVPEGPRALYPKSKRSQLCLPKETCPHRA